MLNTGNLEPLHKKGRNRIGVRIEKKAGRWWYMLLIPALRRQRQTDLCELEANLVYKS